MKKLFFAVIFTAIAMTSINAQKFGAKAGLNIANIKETGEYAESYDNLLGLNIGAVAEFEITEKFAFQPELLFSMQGAKTSYKEDFYYGEYKGKLNYLNIPLIAKYYFAKGFNVQAGPQIGILLSAKSDYTETEIDFITLEQSTTSGTEDIKKYYNSIDFALAFGAGYKMDNGLFFDARYNLGLTDLAKDRDANDNGSLKNSVISFSVGYFFN